MSISLCACVVSVALASQVEDRPLAVIPDELALEGKSIVSPDGATTVKNSVRIVWSFDGAMVGYVGWRGEAPVPVLGDRTFGPYAWAEGPEFSADGKHWAFRVGKSVGKDRQRWCVLLDGKETAAEDWIGAIALAPSGGGWCAWTQPGARHDLSGAHTRGAQVLVSPWKKGAKWDDANSLVAPRFAPDGSFVTTLALKAGQWRLVLADKKGERELGKPESWIATWDVADDAKSFALAVIDSPLDMPPPGRSPDSAKSVIVFGKETFGREYDTATHPVLSPDRNHVAWRFAANLKFGVAVDDGKNARANHDGIADVVWRPDGVELAFAAYDGGVPSRGALPGSGGPYLEGGKWSVVRRAMAGKETPDAATWLEVAGVTWSTDSKLLAYAAKDAEGWRIVCGDKRSAAFDEVGPPRIAADGKSIGFGARKARTLHWKVLELE